MDFVKDLTLGSISAIISKVVLHPFERAMLYVTYSNEYVKRGIIDRPYHGIFDYFVRTIIYTHAMPLKLYFFFTLFLKIKNYICLSCS